MLAFLRFRTDRRFEGLLARHGADLDRWPAADRARAGRWLAGSAEGRRLLDESRRLREAVREASRLEERRLWDGEDRDAALKRLRAGVAARIAPAPARSRRGGPSWAAVPELSRAILIGSRVRWPALTTGSLAIASGLWLGWFETVARTAPIGLMTVLQAPPLHALGW